MVRNSMKLVPYKDYKEVTRDLKLIYHSVTEIEAEQQLVEFGEKWDSKYPQISKSWGSCQCRFEMSALWRFEMSPRLVQSYRVSG